MYRPALILMLFLLSAPAFAYSSRGPVGVSPVEIDLSVLDAPVAEPEPFDDVIGIEQESAVAEDTNPFGLENEREITLTPPATVSNTPTPARPRLTSPLTPEPTTEEATLPTPRPMMPPVRQTAPVDTSRPTILSIDDLAQQKRQELPTPPAQPTAPRVIPTAPPVTAVSPPKPAPKSDKTRIDYSKTRDAARPKPAPEAAQALEALRPVAPRPKTVKQAKADASLLFDIGSTELSLPEQAKLGEIIQRMAAHEQIRLQLRAYASGTTGSPSSARRLSLSRALSVRAYLMDQGIRPTRVDVRALGNEVSAGPQDRVDIQIVN